MSTKALVAIALIGAGVAIAQTALPPELPNNANNIIAPKVSDFEDIRPPGSVREARACSEDIARMCAPETITRRNVPDCLEDRDADVSLSCKAHLARIQDKLNN